MRLSTLVSYWITSGSGMESLHHYPGDLIWEKMHELGYTFVMYVLWKRTYVTSDANVVKVM
jgi:hypothetical protein